MNEETLAMGFFIGFAILYLIIIAVGITSYILNSLSFYTMAKNRGISNPWMAWIPYLSTWTFGSIVDFDDGQRGLKRKWRLTLLVSQILTEVLLYSAIIVMFAVIIVNAALIAESDIPPESFIMGMMIVYAILIIAAMVSTVYQFCIYVCIYKIFEKLAPEKAVKYFILSLLVPLANAILFMKCRNNYIAPQQETPTEYINSQTE